MDVSEPHKAQQSTYSEALELRNVRSGTSLGGVLFLGPGSGYYAILLLLLFLSIPLHLFRSYKYTIYDKFPLVEVSLFLARTEASTWWGRGGGGSNLRKLLRTSFLFFFSFLLSFSLLFICKGCSCLDSGWQVVYFYTHIYVSSCDSRAEAAWQFDSIHWFNLLEQFPGSN